MFTNLRKWYTKCENDATAERQSERERERESTLSKQEYIFEIFALIWLHTDAIYIYIDFTYNFNVVKMALRVQYEQ